MIAEDRRKLWLVLLPTMILSAALLSLGPRFHEPAPPTSLRLNLAGSCGMAAVKNSATQCLSDGAGCVLQFDICGTQGR